MYKRNIHFHCMGISGIGMSAIAMLLRAMGHTVSGCDMRKHSAMLDRLSTAGCTITHMHDPKHLESVDVVIYSSAVRNDNSERMAAYQKGIQALSRGAMLAELMNKQYGIAIAGSHGKTTTTSILAHIMLSAQQDPTIVVGGILKNTEQHTHLGRGKFFIAEADESDRSLLQLRPSLAVITNIDLEHLDVYHDIEDIKETFKQFLATMPVYGTAFVGIDDPHIASLINQFKPATRTFGLSKHADIRASNVQLNKASSTFTLHEATAGGTTVIDTITLGVPGIHNVLNALAALSVARECGVDHETIKHSLASFIGVGRRFEYRGSWNGAEVFDDYGHHPTEIHHTLAIAQKRSSNRVFVVFEPHRYTRTKRLWDDFVALFTRIPQTVTVLITDIYAASEDPIERVTTPLLIEAIKTTSPSVNIVYTKTYSDAAANLRSTVASGDVVVTVGAGPINNVCSSLVD